MARNYSTAFRGTVNSTSAREAPLLLLEITHPGLASPLRVVNDTQDLVSNANTYTALPFRARLPDDLEQGLPRAELSIDNIGKELVQWLEASGGGQGASCRMMQVMRSAPNVIEFEITLDLTNLHMDAMQVSGTLGFENLLDRPACTWVYKPEIAPGLF